MYNSFHKPIKVIGAKLKNKQKLSESQSGGAFTAIAEYFLNKEGIVYGCGMNSELKAVYKRISSISDLKQLKGSKYVQAEMGNALKLVKMDIDAGRLVLFSGTPCYVLAAKNYLKGNKNIRNLYTIDLICHGVPSPLIYQKYLSELEEKAGEKIKTFIFRDKQRGGWNTHIERIVYNSNKEEIRNDYTKLFYTNLSLRPSCGKCKFARIERISDFTIGDFWGIQNKYPDFIYKNGVSVIFLNTEQSLNIFSEVENELEIIDTSIENALQPNLQNASHIPKLRRFFWRDFEKKGVLYCARKWPIIIDTPQKAKTMLKTLLKKALPFICNLKK